MDIALAILSVALVVLSMYGVWLPHRLLGLVSSLASGGLGLWSAIMVRLLLAALLWINAQVSHAPTSFKALAVLLFLSAIAHPIVGRDQQGKPNEEINFASAHDAGWRRRV